MILTNSHHVSGSGTVDHLISDHLSIFAIRKKEKIHSVKVCARGRTYRRYSKDRLGEAISNANWQPLYNSDCPEEQWEVIMYVIVKYLDTDCPIRNINYKKTENTWLNNEILANIADRKEILQEYLRSLDSALLRKARLLRKQINKQVKVAKADFLKHKLDGCEGNPAKFWR